MILQFPTKQNVFKCFDCGKVRILRKDSPVCKECPEPQTKDEKSFLGIKFQVRGSIKLGLGDADSWASELEIFQRMFTDEQFSELQRIITLGLGRNLRPVK